MARLARVDYVPVGVEHSRWAGTPTSAGQFLGSSLSDAYKEDIYYSGGPRPLSPLDDLQREMYYARNYPGGEQGVGLLQSDLSLPPAYPPPPPQPSWAIPPNSLITREAASPFAGYPLAFDPMAGAAIGGGSGVGFGAAVGSEAMLGSMPGSFALAGGGTTGAFAPALTEGVISAAPIMEAAAGGAAMAPWAAPLILGGGMLLGTLLGGLFEPESEVKKQRVVTKAPSPLRRFKNRRFNTSRYDSDLPAGYNV
jgi:hypothetical protein